MGYLHWPVELGPEPFPWTAWKDAKKNKDPDVTDLIEAGDDAVNCLMKLLDQRRALELGWEFTIEDFSEKLDEMQTYLKNLKVEAKQGEF